MHIHDFLLVIIAAASEILGTLSGFGSSTFFVPFALLIESFHLVLALTAILHCFGNTFKISLFYRDLQWKIFLQLAIPSFVFTGIGAVLTQYSSGEWLVQVLGVVLILFSLVSLFTIRSIKRWPKWVAILLSAVSGFSTGFVGTGGAIRGMALAAIQLPKNTFIGVSSAIDVGGDALRAFIYLRNGYMDWNQWFYIPLLILAAFFGARTGKFLLGHINQIQFEKIVAVFIFLSGVVMLFKK